MFFYEQQILQLPQMNPGRVQRRQHRVFRQFPNLATMHYSDSIKKYSLNRQTILDLCHQLEPQFKPLNQNPKAITALVKTMAVLHSAATGSFQYTVGHCNGMSQATFICVL